MKFETTKIKSNLKTINCIDTDILYLDVKANKMYLSSSNTAMEMNIEFTDVSDEKVFVLNKTDFLHIVQYADVVELNSDYSYKANVAKGKFEHNDTFEDVLESIKINFDKSSSYKDLFEITEDNYEKLVNASIFVKPSDVNASNRFLNIQNGYIFSASDYRIYFNKIDIDTDSMIHGDILQNIFTLGVGTKVKSNEDSIFITKDDVSVYYSTMRDVDFLPLLSEKFQTRINGIMNNVSTIKFNTNEFVEKLKFIDFYSKNNPNSLVCLKEDEGKLKLVASENATIVVDSIESEYKEEGEFNLPFNSNYALDMLLKVGKNYEEFTLHASKDNSNKLFIFDFGDERTIFTKLNV